MENNTVTYSSPAAESDKTITMYLELCGKCGFKERLANIEKLIIGGLNELGYNVNYEVLSISPGNNEYDIYVVLNESKKIVFSNASKHLSEGATVQFKVNENNAKTVIDKIIELCNN
jgi:hypothetical protein